MGYTILTIDSEIVLSDWEEKGGGRFWENLVSCDKEERDLLLYFVGALNKNLMIYFSCLKRVQIKTNLGLKTII